MTRCRLPRNRFCQFGDNFARNLPADIPESQNPSELAKVDRLQKKKGFCSFAWTFLLSIDQLYAVVRIESISYILFRFGSYLISRLKINRVTVLVSVQKNRERFSCVGVSETEISSEMQEEDCRTLYVYLKKRKGQRGWSNEMKKELYQSNLKRPIEEGSMKHSTLIYIYASTTPSLLPLFCC